MFFAIYFNLSEIQIGIKFYNFKNYKLPEKKITYKKRCLYFEILRIMTYLVVD